jgi:hypothetical protein
VGLPQRYQHLVNDISSSDGKLMLVDVVIPPGRDPHFWKIHRSEHVSNDRRPRAGREEFRKLFGGLGLPAGARG